MGMVSNQQDMPAPINIPSELIDALINARTVTVLTGAGISAESGIPTFRDAQSGLWSAYRPEELATPQAFQRDPKLVWEWYTWRRDLINRAEPNPGHDSLVIMETRIQDFCLVTQNVDGLHQRAGSKNVLELHGNIHRSRCFREGVLVSSAETKGDSPPKCPGCGSYLRPDVVWFGESLSEDTLRQAWETVNQCDLFFSIGTSALVHPAAALPEIAHRSGAKVVEININRTPLTQKATYFLQGSAALVLPLILRSSWPE